MTTLCILASGAWAAAIVLCVFVEVVDEPPGWLCLIAFVLLSIAVGSCAAKDEICAAAHGECEQ